MRGHEKELDQHDQRAQWRDDRTDNSQVEKDLSEDREPRRNRDQHKTARQMLEIVKIGIDRVKGHQQSCDHKQRIGRPVNFLLRAAFGKAVEIKP